jgi:hypothetical protein
VPTGSVAFFQVLAHRPVEVPAGRAHRPSRRSSPTRRHDPCANLDPEWLHGLNDLLRAPNTPGRPVERREEPVPGAVSTSCPRWRAIRPRTVRDGVPGGHATLYHPLRDRRPALPCNGLFEGEEAL